MRLVAPLLGLLLLALALAGCSSPPPSPSPSPTPGTPPAEPTPAATNGADPCAGALPQSGNAAADVAGLLFHDRAHLDAPGRVSAADRAAWKGGGAAFGRETTGHLGEFLSGPEGVKLYCDTASGPRTDVTAQVGLDTCNCSALGVAPADYDNDGLTDLYVLVQGAPGKLYHNDGGRYTEVPLPGQPSDVTAAFWFDVDNDGKLDLVLLRAGGDPVALRNTGSGFEPFPAATWPPGMGAARTGTFVDLDNDGLMDLLLFSDSGYAAWRNGNGSWAAFSGFQGNVTGNVATPGDDNSAGVESVLVAGDQGLTLLTNYRGRELRVGANTGLPSDPVWSATFLDYDLDGNLDIVAAPKSGGLVAYHNNGDGTFTAVDPAQSGLPTTGDFRGLSLGDFDNDGRTDLLAYRADAPAVLFHNGNGQGPHPNHFFKVVPTGNRTAHDGVGARVVFAQPNALRQRYVWTGGAGLATSAPEVIAGLGGSNVTELRIQWPSGTFQDQSINTGLTYDRILLANEQQSKSQWGDNAC